MGEQKRWAVGIDVGGTKIVVAHVTEEGAIIDEKRFPTRPERDSNQIIQEMADAVKSLADDASFPPVGVGVGMAAQVNTDTGLVYKAPNLNWIDVPMGAMLSEACGFPVTITNDVRAATLGEWKFGSGKGFDDILCLFIGTGIGGGIISQGRLFTGSSNIGGEVGHMIINIDGNKCRCGANGCFEAYAGGWAIAERAKKEIQEDPAAGQALLDLVGGDINSVVGNTVSQGFREGIPLAKKIVDEVKYILARGTANLVNILNPSCIVLGGGVIGGVPSYVDYLQEEVPKLALSSAAQNLTIVQAELMGGKAGTAGAASLVF
jgi:glucokinase